MSLRYAFKSSFAVSFAEMTALIAMPQIRPRRCERRPANGDIDGINGTLYRIDLHVRLVIMLMLQLLPNTTEVREKFRGYDCRYRRQREDHSAGATRSAPGTAPFVE